MEPRKLHMLHMLHTIKRSYYQIVTYEHCLLLTVLGLLNIWLETTPKTVDEYIWNNNEF